MRDVGARGLRVAHAYRRIACRRLAPRAAGIAEHALLELREIREVLVDERVAFAAEARQAILDVRRVARLAHLAVVDDVDAGSHLLADDFGDCGFDASRKRVGLDGDAFCLRIHHPYEIVRPRQAAGVRRQEPLAAAAHGGPRTWTGHCRMASAQRPRASCGPWTSAGRPAARRCRVTISALFAAYAAHECAVRGRRSAEGRDTPRRSR